MSNEYMKMLHEIEEKKQELERRIGAAVQTEITKWQKENNLAVQNVYVSLAQVVEIGKPKHYEVSSVSVDLDYKP